MPIKLEELLGKTGIDNNTTIVLYGDNNNWFAARFWQLRIYGHRTSDGRRPQEVAGGRRAEHGEAAFPAKSYKPSGGQLLRAFSGNQKAVSSSHALVDVRSPQEFTGEIRAARIPETCQRGGHIPGAEHPVGQGAMTMGRSRARRT